MIALAFLLLAAPAHALSPAECNEKIRQQFAGDARAKCAGEPKEIYWSEQELSEGENIFAAFSFRCANQKRYLGIAKVTAPPACEVSPSRISHTSAMPKKALAK